MPSKLVFIYLRLDNFCLLCLFVIVEFQVSRESSYHVVVSRSSTALKYKLLHPVVCFQTSFCNFQLFSNDLQSIQNLSNLSYKNQTFRFYMFYDLSWKKTDIFQPFTTAPGSRSVTCTPIKAHWNTIRGLVKNVLHIIY